MRVGFIQFMPILGDIDQNNFNISRLVDRTDADLVVLPELCNTGYHFVSKQEVKTLAEEIPVGKTTETLCRLAKTRRAYIIAGMIEKFGDKCYNASVLVGPAGYIATYRKIHLYFEETLWFDPGDQEPAVHDIGICRVGLMICFDWIFPETARILALKEADVICHCANLVLPYCQEAMVTRCLENRIFAVTANRIGTETRGGKSLHFTGQSQITGPDGSILYRGGEATEESGVVEIDPTLARNKAINPYNDAFGSRRIEYYGELMKQRPR
ncbi:MAG: acyltransferase [Deltaproteobacteria bacterium]|nr:acyltransferase [Deltaproteobacteria bacterium]